MADLPSRSLDGRIALVTGGTRGLGRHVAAALLAGSARVAITGRGGERARRAAADLPAAVRRAIGDPDLLVNNAAAFAGDRVATMTLDQWNRSVQTNLPTCS